MRIHRDLKPVTTEARRNNLVSEPNYHTTIFGFFYFLFVYLFVYLFICLFIYLFIENWLAIEYTWNIRETPIYINEPVYLGIISILELSQVVIYEFWYDYVK